MEVIVQLPKLGLDIQKQWEEQFKISVLKAGHWMAVIHDGVSVSDPKLVMAVFLF